jgi:hypothetical protein
LKKKSKELKANCQNRHRSSCQQEMKARRICIWRGRFAGGQKDECSRLKKSILKSSST